MARMRSTDQRESFRNRITPRLIALALLGACTSTHESGTSVENVPAVGNAPQAAAPTAASSNAQSNSKESRLALERSDAKRLAADVTWLADDAREGRRAGTEQGKVCADWIAERLKSLGLEPLGEKGYEQQFTVALDPRDGGKSSLRWAAGQSGAVYWANSHATPLFCSESGAVEGMAVFCGYGIEDASRNWNDFEHADVSGAIAFIARGTPTAPPTTASNAAESQLVSKGDGWAGTGSIFTKVMNAKRHGARGVVLVPSVADEAVPRFDAGHGARAGIPAVAIDYGLAKTILGAQYLDELQHPARVKLDTFVSQHPVTFAADVITGNGPAYNVLGLLRGKDSSRAIVIGAHYDHLGRGGTGSLAPDKGGEIHHGADDNASGTATVLEIARLMKARGTPPCDVVFALWSGEELGLLGSEYWAEHPTVPLDKITCNLNLDMVGRAGNGKIQVLGAGTSPDFAEWMKDAGERSGLELIVSTSGNSLGGSSDHQTFLKRKIPALHLFSGLHADYHKPSDTADKFEADGAAKVAELGVVFADDMARETKLAFIEPKIDKEREKETKGGFRCWFGSVPSYSYEGKGVLLDGTSNGSPAERAGLLKGDVLVQVGEIRIDTIYDMVYALQLYKPGDVVLAKYVRDGAMQESRVTLSSRELQ